MPTYRGLYYPYIHFRSENWLKAAALYWDQIGRIIPSESYTLHDSDTVQKLRDAKFVKEWVPLGAELTVSKAFQQLIEEWKQPLKAAYSVRLRDGWAVDEYTAYAAPPWAHQALGYVSVGKIDPDLQDLLSKEDLATKHERGGWLGMHPRLVRVYMTALAEAMASERGAHPLTDDVVDHVSVAGLEADRIAQALLSDANIRIPIRPSREIEEAIVTVAIEASVPAGLSNIDASEILDMRKKYVGLRSAFQAGVAAVVKEVPDLAGSGPDDFTWHVTNAYEKHVQTSLEELKQSLRESKVEMGIGLIGAQIAVPGAVGSALAAMGLVLAAPIGLGIGIAWSAWTAARSRRVKARELEKGNWAAYLLRIEEAFEARQMTREVQQTAQAVQAASV